MMRSVITFAFALILSAPALSQEDRMTGGTFLELEAAAVDPTGSPLVTLYLMATLDSLGIANAVLEQNERAPLYCLPARDTLSAADMRTIVVNYLDNVRSTTGERDHAFILTAFPLAAIALNALEKRFPCGD